MLTESTAAALLANFDVARAELAEHAEVARAELAELADGALVRRSSAPCARASVELPRWPGALSICRIGYRAGRSRSPVLWSTRVAVHMRVLHSRSRLQRQINVHLDRRRRHLGLANVVDLDVVDERKRLARRKHRLLVHKLGLTAERLPAVEALNTTSSRDYQVPAGPLNMLFDVEK